MSMEAEVTRARCVALFAQLIEAGEIAGKRSVTLDELRGFMMTVMRMPLPGDEAAGVPFARDAIARSDAAGRVAGEEGFDGTR